MIYIISLLLLPIFVRSPLRCSYYTYNHTLQVFIDRRKTFSSKVKVFIIYVDLCYQISKQVYPYNKYNLRSSKSIQILVRRNPIYNISSWVIIRGGLYFVGYSTKSGSIIGVRPNLLKKIHKYMRYFKTKLNMIAQRT